MPQSIDQRKNWTPPALTPVPQIHVGGERGSMHRLKRDPMKRYGSYDDWYDKGQSKFGTPPVLRST